MSSDRRRFLRWTFGGVAGLAVADSSVLGASAATAGDPRLAEAAPLGDDPWLAALAGKKHKAFLDVMHFFPDGTPFRRGRNVLGVLHESYGAAEGEIGVVLGMHGPGLAHGVSQAVWDDLGLLEWLAPRLSAADSAALKAGAGTYASAGAAAVSELRARGARFLACRETISRWSQRVATQKGEPAATIAERIVRGLHEGVEPVPAMTVAAVQAQSRGAAYVAVS